MLKKFSAITITLLLTNNFAHLNAMDSMKQMPMMKAADTQSIKTISFQRVLTNLDKSKDAEKEVVAERKKWEDKIKKIETDIKNKVATLEAKAKTAKSDALEKDKEDIEKLQREGKNTVQEADATLQKKFNKVMADLQKEIRDKIVSISQKNGWDLVIAEEAGVLYTADRMKVDDVVIKEMNADYAKEKAPKKPEASTPTPPVAK